MRRIIISLIEACALQLILSTAALPFLLWWHIPYPLLSILGNLIHPFFLTSFLSLASLLFFAVLLGLPHDTIAWLLTTLTQTWHALFSLPIKGGWIALQWWHLIPAISIATAILSWYLLASLTHNKKRIFIVLVVINSTTALWQIQAHHNPGITFLHKANKHLVCIPHKHHTELVDFGYLAHTRNKESLFTYEIMPHLLFFYGKEEYTITYH